MSRLSELLFGDEGAEEKELMFVTVILPIPLAQLYTYSVPLHLREFVRRGLRVEVPFRGSKLYAGLVYEILTQAPSDYTTKPILSVLDETPIVTDAQYKLWEWIAHYYVCTLGEVMQAALPAGFKLNSETRLVLHEAYEDQDIFLRNLNSRESFLIEYLVKHNEITIDETQKLLNLKTVQPLIKLLLEKRLIVVKEELAEKYRPKKVSMLRLSPTLAAPEALQEAFKKVQRAGRQTEALLVILQLSKIKPEISRKEVYEAAAVDSSVLKRLEELGYIELFDIEISRLIAYAHEGIGNFALSEIQQKALEETKAQFEEKNVVLLHGVTGSGKTQVFVELIEEVIAQGKQVLYLLPEIALTAQIVGRLQKHFGDKILVYHSKFSTYERVEIWQRAMQGTPILLGARSAMFLPFKNLGLILVDEEHDPSYKQTDPAPRYNARDTAVYLAHLHGCKILLGTATPSIETYYNVQQKKYGLVEMKNRFGGISMPEIFLVDIAEETKQKRMKSHFSPQLIDALKECFDKGEQAILFQNRRGYAPMYKCNTCGWNAECNRCDVALTYHKFSNDLHCHYCGLEQRLPRACPACGSVHLGIQGFGTEKIEDELQIYLPEAKVIRMDLDTVRGKNGADKIIQQFEQQEVNVLVGTQMVTKGLDFDNVGLVGVLSADQMLKFPDFRASERAYQLLTQVAGRAGRKRKRGRVLVQAFQVGHPVLHELRTDDFDAFLLRELQERQDFNYPPFSRLIKIQLRHKTDSVVVQAAKFYAQRLTAFLGSAQVLGPAVPGVSKIREYFILEIMLKLPRNTELLNRTKTMLLETQQELKQIKDYSAVRIGVDVDPY